MNNSYFCQCCWFHTVDDSYEICQICNWEDDPVQNNDPLCKIGANKMSLFEAQKELIKKIPSNIKSYKWFTRSNKWKILEHEEIKMSDINNWVQYFDVLKKT